MSKFMQAARVSAIETTTENGEYALSTSLSKVLDLFARVGAMRGASESEIVSLFDKAYAENKELAVKTLMYARNIRGGLGERRSVRILLKYMGQRDPKIAEQIIPYVPFYGRWDDLYTFVGTPVEKPMFAFLKAVLTADIKAKREGSKDVTLLAKWLKSVNTSSAESVKLGKLTAQALGMGQKEYRKILVEMREYLGVLEVQLSKNDFAGLEYKTMCTRALFKYRRAFKTKDAENYGAFIEGLNAGTIEKKSDALYPYDVVRAYNNARGYNGRNYDASLEGMWKTIPDYVNGEFPVVVMADTSGSMQNGMGDVNPIDLSLSLAVYFAERNKGVWGNMFMTFSNQPDWIELTEGSTLCTKLNSIPQINANTNYEAAYKLILDTAKRGKVAPEDMPKALIVISDMQFDESTSRVCIYRSERIKELVSTKMRKAFAAEGYELPTCVYWNVNAKKATFHATADDRGVLMVSGCAPSVFKQVLEGLGRTPMQHMMEVLSAYELEIEYK